MKIFNDVVRTTRGHISIRIDNTNSVHADAADRYHTGRRGHRRGVKGATLRAHRGGVVSRVYFGGATN